MESKNWPHRCHSFASPRAAPSFQNWYDSPFTRVGAGGKTVSWIVMIQPQGDRRGPGSNGCFSGFIRSVLNALLGGLKLCKGSAKLATLHRQALLYKARK